MNGKIHGTYDGKFMTFDNEYEVNYIAVVTADYTDDKQILNPEVEYIDRIIVFKGDRLFFNYDDEIVGPLCMEDAGEKILVSNVEWEE